MATHKVINGLLYQCCWFLALLISWQTAVIVLSLLLFHGIRYEPKQHEYLRLLCIAILGIFLDGLWINLSIINVVDEYRDSLFNMPFWLMTVWVGFVLTIGSSLSWLAAKKRLFPWLCMVLGPLSYMAGERLEVVELTSEGLAVLAAQWFVIGWLLSNVGASASNSDPAQSITTRQSEMT